MENVDGRANSTQIISAEYYVALKKAFTFLVPKLELAPFKHVRDELQHVMFGNKLLWKWQQLGSLHHKPQIFFEIKTQAIQSSKRFEVPLRVVSHRNKSYLKNTFTWLRSSERLNFSLPLAALAFLAAAGFLGTALLWGMETEGPAGAWLTFSSATAWTWTEQRKKKASLK